MSDEHAFLRAIAESPDDDTPRLVFADWLDEHGDADRAEFIRLQCRLARDPRGAETPRRTRRCLALLRRHARAWLSGMPEWVVAEQVGSFERGFPHHVHVIDWRAFLRDPDALWRAAPTVRGLAFQDLGAEGAAALAGCPHLARLVCLDVRGNEIGDAGAAALAHSPHLAGLRELVLIHNRLGPAAARALAESPHLGELSALHLFHNGLGAAGAVALAAPDALPRLTTLDLGENDLRGTRIWPLFCRIGLTRLDLRGNPIRTEALRYLVTHPTLRTLRYLNLSNSLVGDGGAAGIAASPHLAGLTELELGLARIGDRGAKALAESPHLHRLKRLILFGNDIAAEGARALAESPAVRRLEFLDLNENPVPEESTALLRRRFGKRVRLSPAPGPPPARTPPPAADEDIPF